VISAVTPAGQLFTRMQDTAFHGGDVVRFLGHLERQLGGKLLIVWDRAKIHRGAAVREYLSAGHAARLELHSLPGYAPDLNPDEGVWHWLKGQLANVSCLDLPQLRDEIQRHLRRLRQHPHLIQGFFREAGYG
jgi:transposase